MKTGRPIEIRIELNDEQRQELRRLAREAIGRISERAHFVLLSDQGKSVPEIGALMGYSAQAVYPWLERYLKQDVAGLYDEPRSGRPPNEPHLVAIVQAQTGQPPANFGYPAPGWTVGGLLQHLRQRFRIRVSRSTLRRALPLADFVWGRPKLILPQRRDPAEDAKVAHLIEILADPTAIILAEDECDMMLLPILRATWHRRGEQPRVLTPGQNRKRPIFGTVNLRTGVWHYRLTDRKRSVEFIAALTSLLAAYPDDRLFVLVDNGSIHTSKAVQQWLQTHERLQLVSLPSYAGHKYNPTEKIWWHLKDAISANRSFKVLAELDTALRQHFASLTSQAILRLINSFVARQAQAAVAA
jgi:putative transposase